MQSAAHKAGDYLQLITVLQGVVGYLPDVNAVKQYVTVVADAAFTGNAAFHQALVVLMTVVGFDLLKRVIQRPGNKRDMFDSEIHPPGPDKSNAN